MVCHRFTPVSFEQTDGRHAPMSDRAVYVAITVATAIIVALMIWLLFL